MVSLELQSFLVLTFIVAISAKDYSEGHMHEGDVVACHFNIDIHPHVPTRPNAVRECKLTDEYEKITYIHAHDFSTGRHKSRVKVMSGGAGQRFVKLQMIGTKRHALQYRIDVYAKKHHSNPEVQKGADEQHSNPDIQKDAEEHHLNPDVQKAVDE